MTEPQASHVPAVELCLTTGAVGAKETRSEVSHRILPSVNEIALRSTHIV